LEQVVDPDVQLFRDPVQHPSRRQVLALLDPAQRPGANPDLRRETDLRHVLNFSQLADARTHADRDITLCRCFMLAHNSLLL
jgi:hypothetical protein